MRPLNDNEINAVAGAGWINDIGEKLRDYFDDFVSDFVNPSDDTDD